MRRLTKKKHSLIQAPSAPHGSKNTPHRYPPTLEKTEEEYDAFNSYWVYMYFSIIFSLVFGVTEHAREADGRVDLMDCDVCLHCSSCLRFPPRKSRNGLEVFYVPTFIYMYFFCLGKSVVFACGDCLTVFFFYSFLFCFFVFLRTATENAGWLDVAYSKCVCVCT